MSVNKEEKEIIKGKKEKVFFAGKNIKQPTNKTIEEKDKWKYCAKTNELFKLNCLDFLTSNLSSIKYYVNTDTILKLQINHKDKS